MRGPLLLVRSGDALVRGCTCARGVAGLPQVSAAPWTGPGWLFSCIDCAEPFAFARTQEADHELDALARRDLGPDASDEAIASWVEQMTLFTEPMKPDREVVFLDGTLIPTHAFEVHLEGWFADHDLTSVPHVEARRNPALLDSLLASPAYWLEGAARRLRAEGRG